VWIAITIALLSTVYLAFTAHRQDRDFFPKTLDDQAYVVQMHMLAQGRLWMPQHLCADFFDTFHIFVKPKYASAYFPGTAMLYTPTVWLRLPTWIGPVVVAGAIIGFVYLIVTELANGVAGILAGLVVLASNWFRMLSILVYGQPVALLLGLITFFAWLRWRDSHRNGWAVLMGAAGGFLVITRPIDGICYAVPIAAAMLMDKKRPSLATMAIIIASAIPFLAVQAIQNIGITGKLTKTPFGLYLDRDQPGANFGFHAFDPASKPVSTLPQKQIYYQQLVVPFLQKHTLDQTGTWMKDHLPQIVDVILPARIMLLLVPVGLLGLGKDSRRWALAATFALFLLLYFNYAWFLEHYAVPFVPAVAMTVAIAPSVLRERLPRIGNWAYLAGILLVAIISLSMLPELNSKVTDETFRSPMMRVLHDRVDGSDLAPAVILFRYHPELPQEGINSYNIEPVYNTDVAWPDDAPIIRAHDLGSRNVELFRYYAEHQPQRTFYLFDRGNPNDPLHRLGSAEELARGVK
jgi:hypothetical protein